MGGQRISTLFVEKKIFYSAVFFHQQNCDFMLFRDSYFSPLHHNDRYKITSMIEPLYLPFCMFIIDGIPTDK